jgi:hypothetical protein
MRHARLLVLCLALVSLPAFADDLTSLTLFRTGVFTDSIGTANLVVRDVTRDGVADLVSCSEGSAFVLTHSGTTLTPSWFSEPVGCTAATAGDATGDGNADVIVGTYNATNGNTSGGAIVVYDPQTFGPAKARVNVPGTNAVTDVAYGDVDRDGRPEIIAITSVDAFVYDAATLTLEWSALGKGGSKVALGDLEGDGGIEIIVNGSYGHVLDAQAQIEKWGYVGGFGRSMAVGDVDQDGKAEIVFVPNSSSDSVTIIEGDTFQVSTLTVGSVDRIAIGDANADGVPELMIGYYSTIRGIRRSNGQLLWSISNSSYSANAITAGDVDGDGVPEVIWGASNVLYTASAATQAVKWHSADLDNDFGGVVADLDGDGKLELVMKTVSTEGSYSGGALQIFDLQTRALKYSIAPPTGYSSRKIYRLQVAQMDSDPALEIVVLGQNSYDPYLYVIDGVTGVTEYQSPYTAYYSTPGFLMNGLWVGNVDGDATNEIVVGTTDNKIEVLNGASSFIQWSSVALDGYITDLSVADVDHDGSLEIVASTSNGVWVFTAATGVVRSHITLGNINHVAATSEGGGYFAISTSNGLLRLYSGTSTLVWECASSYNLAATALSFYKLSGELRMTIGDNAGNLKFYPLTGSGCPSPLVRNVSRGQINSIGSYETTGDTNPEMLLSYYYSIELNSFSLSRYARGDFDGDGLVTDADIDALALYLYGGGPGSGPAADVNSDGAVAADDLFYLINYKRGTGPAPLP